MSETKILKIYKKIPVYIVENHNDVLQFIFRSIGSGHLPLYQNTIIHFDSHPDMSIPRAMPAITVSDKYALFEEIHIESWIMPAVYAGHINDIVWVKPYWATQMPESVCKFEIGEDIKTGTIRVTSNLDYFLSEGLYSSEIKNQRDVMLDVITLDNSSFKTKKQLIYNHICGMYILDIDLDFFSTHNPFKVMFDKGDIYMKLKDIFRYDKPKSANSYDIEMAVEKRQSQLDSLENIFNFLDEHRNLNDFDGDKTSETFNKVYQLSNEMLNFYEEAQIDWTIVFNAGCTWDDPEYELPHHETDDVELQELLDIFKDFIKTIPEPPTIITIARSSEDDYCPAHQVDRIQESVLHILKSTFNTMEPLLAYLNSSE